jgi:hypothetical protein
MISKQIKFSKKCEKLEGRSLSEVIFFVSVESEGTIYCLRVAAG